MFRYEFARKLREAEEDREFFGAPEEDVNAAWPDKEESDEEQQELPLPACALYGHTVAAVIVIPKDVMNFPNFVGFPEEYMCMKCKKQVTPLGWKVKE